VVMTKRPTQKKIILDDEVNEGDIAPLPFKTVPELEPEELSKVKLFEADTPSKVKIFEAESPMPQRERAFKLVAPVEKPGYKERLLKSVLETKMEIEIGELVRASPELARSLRQAITRSRQPLSNRTNSVKAFQQDSAFPYLDNSEFLDIKLDFDALSMDDLPAVTSCYISTEEDRGMDPNIRPDSIIVPDPYMQYLSNLGPDEIPKQVFVASDSASLRVINPLVNGNRNIEAVIDSGSQIVSMSLSEAEDAAIGWDPDIQIFMQGAGGQVKKSAGLARNVAFLFGDITVYLQVHVIDQPAYKILLGRPFDILTESRISNRADGSQTITLRDPNTGRRCVLPTRARGTFTSVATRPSIASSGDPPPQPDVPKQSASTQSKRATVEEVPDSEDELSEEEDPGSEEDDPDFHRSSMI
jgi:hypothetical protein